MCILLPNPSLQPHSPTSQKNFWAKIANFPQFCLCFVSTCLALIRVPMASRALMQMSETTRSGFWGLGMSWLSNRGFAGGRTGSGSGALRFFGGWGAIGPGGGNQRQTFYALEKKVAFINDMLKVNLEYRMD